MYDIQWSNPASQIAFTILGPRLEPRRCGAQSFQGSGNYQPIEEMYAFGMVSVFLLQDVNILVASWWLNQPLWKICSSKWGIFPKVRGENKKYLKPPPSSCRVDTWSSNVLIRITRFWSGYDLHDLHHARHGSCRRRAPLQNLSWQNQSRDETLISYLFIKKLCENRSNSSKEASPPKKNCLKQSLVSAHAEGERWRGFPQKTPRKRRRYRYICLYAKCMPHFFKALFSCEKGTILWHTWKIQVSICAMKRSALILPTPFLHKSLHWYTILMVHHWSILNSIVFTASSNPPTTVPFLSRLKQPNNIRYKRRAQMPFTGPKIEVLWSPPEIMNLKLGAQKINPTPSHVVPLCSSTQPKGPEDSNLRTWKSLQTFGTNFNPQSDFFVTVQLFALFFPS